MSSATLINGKTYYEILDLPTSCTSEEIKKAYKTLQLKHHPDKTRDLPLAERSASEAISKAVNVVYEILGDEHKRRYYDSKLQKTTPPSESASSSQSGSPPKPSRPTPPSEPRAHSSANSYSSFTECPEPATTSHSLFISSVRWKFTIHLNPRFQSTMWGPNYTWEEPNKILIFIKLSKTPTPFRAPHETDIQLLATHTPNGRRITKIESYYKHRVTASGPELNLWIKLCTDPTADLLRGPWQFNWDVEIFKDTTPPNPQCQRYGTNMYFYHKLPGRDAPHPTQEMMKDRDMGPTATIRFARLRSPCKTVFTGNEAMTCVSAFGYQTEGLESTPLIQPQTPHQPSRQNQQPAPSTRERSARYTPYAVPKPFPQNSSKENIHRMWTERIEKAGPAKKRRQEVPSPSSL